MRPRLALSLLLVGSSLSIAGLAEAESEAAPRAIEIAARLPGPVAEPAAFFDGRYAYVLTGRLCTACAAIVRFDPQSMEVQNLTADFPRRLSGAAVAWDGRHAYFFGGEDNAGLSDAIVRYDPATDKATLMSARLPDAQRATAALWTGKFIAVLGGDKGGYGAGNEVVLYDPIKDVARHAGTLPASVARAGTVWDGTRAHVVGGDSRVPRMVMRFTPEQFRGDFGTAQLPLDRLLDSATAAEGTSLYLLGGRVSTTERTATILRYDAMNETFETLPDSLPVARSGSAAVSTGQLIFVFGGSAVNGVHSDGIVAYAPPGRPAPRDPARDVAVLPDRGVDPQPRVIAPARERVAWPPLEPLILQFSVSNPDEASWVDVNLHVAIVGAAGVETTVEPAHVRLPPGGSLPARVRLDFAEARGVGDVTEVTLLAQPPGGSTGSAIAMIEWVNPETPEAPPPEPAQERVVERIPEADAPGLNLAAFLSCLLFAAGIGARRRT